MERGKDLVQDGEGAGKKEGRGKRGRTQEREKAVRKEQRRGKVERRTRERGEIKKSFSKDTPCKERGKDSQRNWRES